MQKIKKKPQDVVANRKVLVYAFVLDKPSYGLEGEYHKLGRNFM